jgi:glycosyltransferase involved in cell wall biosynthesis
MKSEFPLVSILMPNFNKEIFLRETLLSIVNQRYSNWECIIVDDHSTDTSWTILTEFANLDPRIMVIRRPDQLIKGANSCRNFAFSLSSGEYIQYLDSDDQLSPDKLERQINQAQEGELNDVFVSNWILATLGLNAELNCFDRFDDYPSDPLDLILKGWKERSYVPIFSYLLPRNLVEISGGWDENLIRNQDGEFSCRLLANANKVYYDNVGFGAYFHSIGSGHVSENSSLEAIESVWYSFLSYEEVIKTKRFDNSVRKALVANYQHLFFVSIGNFPGIAKQAFLKVRTLGYRLDFEYIFFLKLFLWFGFDVGYILYRVRMKLQRQS